MSKGTRNAVIWDVANPSFILMCPSEGCKAYVVKAIGSRSLTSESNLE